MSSRGGLSLAGSPEALVRPRPAESRDSSSPPAARPREDRFRPDIEGLRGIAVLLVVWYHMRLGGMPGGFIGVDVFFVISGYLITGLLVAEVGRTGRIDLPAFYARRVRRLLPAAILVVLVTLASGAVLLAPREQLRASSSAMAASLYISNLRYMLGDAGYFAATLETDPFLHTWSLAVEEQFYLVWPVLVLLSLRGPSPRRRLACVMAAVTVVSLGASVWLTWHEPTWAFFGSPARAWEFGLGAAGVLLPRAALGRSTVLQAALGWAGLALVLATAVLVTGESRFPGWVALTPVLGTVMMLAVGGAIPRGGVGRLLGLAPLQRVGELSYSWYLWHWPVLVLAQSAVPTLGLAGRLLCSAASLGIAAVTHRLIENPVRFHPRLVARAAWGLALGAVLTLSGAGVSAVARLSADRERKRPEYAAVEAAAAAAAELPECGLQRADGRLLPCGELAPEGRPTVVLFGDSHAGHWGPALRPLALSSGWRLVVMTKGACPAAYARVKESFGWDAQFGSHCRAWREEALARIAGLRPELVIVADSREHVLGPRRKDNRLRSTAEEWQRGNRRLLQALDTLASSTLLIGDTPRLGFDVPLCLGRARKQAWLHQLDCGSERTAALDQPVIRAERAAAAGLTRVSVVDPSDAFCQLDRCEPSPSGVLAYSDADHIAPGFAARLTPLMREWVESADLSGRLRRRAACSAAAVSC